jgi:hypothetical protein
MGTPTSPALALLAPVPYMHLESGLDTCRSFGSVIFGSDRWGLFEDRGVEAGAPVYLYASLTHMPGVPQVTYLARYVRMYRHEELGREQLRRRPPTTEGPNEGVFVVYWEVEDLTKLADREVFAISDLSTEDGRHLNPAFIPHGPLAVAG